MSKLINSLIKQGYLKSDVLIEAFFNIERKEFLPRELEDQSEANIALPIGYGQTISQPLTVAFMLELLNPRVDQKILDIGSGSGWTTALLSFVVREKGKVVALERIKELVDFGKKNVQKFGFCGKGIAEFYEANGFEGFPREAPFDRILVSASVEEIPPALKEQLKIGGKLVIPVNQTLYCLEKKDENNFFEERFPGFEFVPFIKN
ncbi:MAG: protein-L-isoaspartate O-methyltransferase [Candidatus Moranbacteria bacterium CG_4_9_14_3_um_filter_40_7]|nr:MAG: protein-L-isoaspartate O-methyltransferase [Candidatus Moranbacteria bacterium CG23_combo_of_CG06-09_8_20_14_all_40_16]PIU80439.1 MAG: protein-L-isoaspartate O-methyltransferase [Candidatus Moranbacteria bacterium CG06_land_8_20_14_3_00_40_12]PJA87764.1 MAG: protein-L-isoaspartate O-methyltransferase [Candidatus Moranbacteria bacterium CG_4_9_14_3_um_filter_40_7]